VNATAALARDQAGALRRGEERRRHDCFPIERPARLLIGARQVQARTLDISQSGLSLPVPKALGLASGEMVAVDRGRA
jgi:hypothetical protein